MCTTYIMHFLAEAQCSCHVASSNFIKNSSRLEREKTPNASPWHNPGFLGY